MIYLDYAATTPLDPQVLKKMSPYFSQEFANPASIHSLGQTALRAVEDARYMIADSLQIKASEIIFCSGATEANNLALRGLLTAAKEKGDTRNHIISCVIEHDSILEPLHYLEKEQYHVTYLPVNKEGVASLSNLERAVSDKTILITIAFVNSEIGSVQPIAKIGRLIRKINERRLKEWLNTPTRKRGPKPRLIYFHTDATQAANYFFCNSKALTVDLMSFSGHKIFGPKGIGFLVCKKDVPMQALQFGGHQERNLRSGTLNVPSIIGLAMTFQKAQKNVKQNYITVSKLRDFFVKELRKSIPQLKQSIVLKEASPSHANFLFPRVTGDALLSVLDEQGVAVSTGSACASGDLDTSHVINALGYDKKTAASALRFTLSTLTTKAELVRAVSIIKRAYKLCLSRFEN